MPHFFNLSDVPHADRFSEAVLQVCRRATASDRQRCCWNTSKHCGPHVAKEPQQPLDVRLEPKSTNKRKIHRTGSQVPSVFPQVTTGREMKASPGQLREGSLNPGSFFT